jgi:predicted RNA-binding Zn ribbon-like protein
LSDVQDRVSRAPGELAAVQAFVNTLDIEQATDELRDVHALRGWLQSTGLWPGQPGRTPTGDELTEALRLRETLRVVLRSHAGHDGQSASESAEYQHAVADIRHIAAGLPVRLDVHADGQIKPAAAGSGVDAALARILLIAAQAAAIGTWTRLKACSAGDCQWAFYDRSPTRNGCWCSMQVCGARAKSRAYRTRLAAVRQKD